MTQCLTDFCEVALEQTPYTARDYLQCQRTAHSEIKGVLMAIKQLVFFVLEHRRMIDLGS